MSARYILIGERELTTTERMAYLRRVKLAEWETAETSRRPGRTSRDCVRLHAEYDALTSRLVELVGWSGTAQLDDWLDYATFKRIEVRYESTNGGDTAA